MNATAFVDHYIILEVAPTATEPVINAAYKAKMRLNHPDRGGDPVVAQRLNTARDVLTNPVDRAAFDAERLAHINPHPAPTENGSAPYTAPAPTGQDGYYSDLATRHARRNERIAGTGDRSALLLTGIILATLATLAAAFVIHAIGYLYILGLGLDVSAATGWTAFMFFIYAVIIGGGIRLAVRNRR